MLEVKDLTLSVFGQKLLEGIDLTIKSHETLCVIGPTGSGKTRLLQTVAGFFETFSGKVIVNRYNLAKDPYHAKLNLSYLGSPVELPLYLSAFEYLSLIAASYNISGKRRVERILELSSTFGADEFLYTTLDRLGTAFHQQVGLIAALLPESPVVVLDEPETHLDYAQIEALKDNIRQLKGKGSSIFVATNDLSFATEISEHFLLISEAVVSHSGTLREIYNQVRPEHESLGSIYKTVFGSR